MQQVFKIRAGYRNEIDISVIPVKSETEKQITLERTSFSRRDKLNKSDLNKVVGCDDIYSETVCEGLQTLIDFMQKQIDGNMNQIEKWKSFQDKAKEKIANIESQNL